MASTNLPPLYGVWQSMRRRCLTPTNKAFKDYGGRGIRICPEWNSYAQFAADMGERPLGTTIERIDNNGNYEPGNCRWATRKEQQRNRRIARYVTIDGKQYRAMDLAGKAGVKTDTIIERAEKGLSYRGVISKKKTIDMSGLALGGLANGKRNRALTHCKAGHAFTPENTRITPEGWRNCRTCHRLKMRKVYAARRGEVSPAT